MNLNAEQQGEPISISDLPFSLKKKTSWFDESIPSDIYSGNLYILG